MSEVCRDCSLGLKREDCSENEFKECINEKFNKNLYSLYFLKGKNKEEFYGAGDKEYMSELINDYIATNNMYGKDDITFTVKRGF